MGRVQGPSRVDERIEKYISSVIKRIKIPYDKDLFLETIRDYIKSWCEERAKNKDIFFQNDFCTEKTEFNYTGIPKEKQIPIEKNGYLSFPRDKQISISEQLDYSLDVEENIVSLCSNCHNQLHYGSEIDGLISKLYKDRKDMLLSVGINILYENLRAMYF